MAKKHFPSLRDINIVFDREPPKYYTEDEVDQILAVIKKPRDHLIVNFLYRTGVRISEMLMLKVSHIDFYSKTVRILTLKQKVRDGKLPIRTIPLSTKLIDELEDYISLLNLKDNDRLFPITRQRVHVMFTRYCKMAGLYNDKSHVHSLRHGFAVYHARRKVPIPTLQRWLGHRDILNVLIYTNITALDTREFMD